MPYGKCGEARAGMSCRSGGVESRNSSDLLPAESRAPDGKAELLPSREVLCIRCIPGTEAADNNTAYFGAVPA